jgi:hypothetical protein
MVARPIWRSSTTQRGSPPLLVCLQNNTARVFCKWLEYFQNILARGRPSRMCYPLILARRPPCRILMELLKEEDIYLGNSFNRILIFRLASSHWVPPHSVHSTTQCTVPLNARFSSTNVPKYTFLYHPII